MRQKESSAVDAHDYSGERNVVSLALGIAAQRNRTEHPSVRPRKNARGSKSSVQCQHTEFEPRRTDFCVRGIH